MFNEALIVTVYGSDKIPLDFTGFIMLTDVLYSLAYNNNFIEKINQM